MEPNSPTESPLRIHNWKHLELQFLHGFEIAKLFHKHVHHNILSTFSKIFTESNSTSRLSSNNSTVHIPRYKTAKLFGSFKFQGVKFWNSIPKVFQTLSFSQFQNFFKTKLISFYWISNKTMKCMLRLNYTILVGNQVAVQLDDWSKLSLAASCCQFSMLLCKANSFWLSDSNIFRKCSINDFAFWNLVWL